MEDYKRYTDLLKDGRFIRWQLLGDDELNEYWQNVVQNDSNTAEEISQVISFLKTTGLNKPNLSDTESAQLLKGILDSINQNEKKRRKQRIIKYFSAVCAIVLITITITVSINNTLTEKTEVIQLDKEHATGSFLNGENIKLITKDESHSFQSDINIQIDKQGKTKIVQPGSKTERIIETDNSTLNKLIVPYGKRANLALADGSRVWLNSGTEMEFPTVFNGKTRKIKVVGEIFIEVVHDKNKSFIVHTPNSEIKVLGTSFNVSSYDTDEQEFVVLAKGVVRIYNDRDSLTLAPNEMAILKENNITCQRVNVSEYISWKSGYWELNKTSIEEVLKKISRYYNVKFETLDRSFVTDKTCTGRLYLFDNINDLLKSISDMTQLKFEQKQNIIYIK